MSKDYRKPVVCNTEEDIKDIGEEMKVYGRTTFHDKKPTYCKNEAEVLEEAKLPDVRDFIMNCPGIRCLFLRGMFPVTISLTLDTWKNPVAWNLSMSVPTGKGIERVPDQITTLVARCILGEGSTEIPPEGSLKQVRQ